MKCQEVVEIMKFLPLRQFEFQIYIAFMIHNNHGNMSWSNLLLALLISGNSCLSMEIFHLTLFCKKALI